MLKCIVSFQKGSYSEADLFGRAKGEKDEYCLRHILGNAAIVFGKVHFT